jgi:hypothetical protein
LGRAVRVKAKYGFTLLTPLNVEKKMDKAFSSFDDEDTSIYVNNKDL